MRKLSHLTPHIPGLISCDDDEVIIMGISLDSRTVKPGDIFVAIEGVNIDGHKFIPNAIKAGASAVLGTQVHKLPVPYLRVSDSREALAYLSASYYDFPAKKLIVIGITGTDGKTTTSNLLYHIFKAAGIKAGMISTVNAVIGDQIFDTGFHVTTPDAPDLQHYLAMMVEAGLTHVILETTSHGLEQKRVVACEFDVGVITNITHEHLDAHNGSLDRYRAAKARLFSELGKTNPKILENPKLSVTNRDDWSYQFLQSYITSPQVSYGLTSKADVRGENITYDPSSLQFTAKWKDLQFEINSHLVGAFNVSNCLAALSAAIVGLDIDPKKAVEGIAQLKGIPGRMERINMGQEFTAVVDFAHTPYALLNAIRAARTMTNGRVIVLFGSAGLRDREKRRMMAEIAAEWSDFTILTAEDPRTESLDDILREMAGGAVSKGGIEKETFWCVPDRGEAIRLSLNLAQPDDFVMACGKGHEQSMCFGTKEYHWDDRTAMRAALAEYLGIDGPDMPYLPTQD